MSKEQCTHGTGFGDTGCCDECCDNPECLKYQARHEVTDENYPGNMPETKASDTLMPERLLADLAHFTGSDNWYKHFTGMLYTDGIQHLAEAAGAYWLIDLAGSYQHGKVKRELFQVWTLKVADDNTAVIEMRSDTNEPVLVSQRIPFTDFPLKEFSFWVVDGTMLLKSEY